MINFPQQGLLSVNVSQVDPLASRFINDSPVCCGPVLELSLFDSPSDVILKPVKVKFPHPLVFHGSEQRAGDLRILYKEINNEDEAQWMDITDDIVMGVEGNIVTMGITHFSM